MMASTGSIAGLGGQFSHQDQLRIQNALAILQSPELLMREAINSHQVREFDVRLHLSFSTRGGSPSPDFTCCGEKASAFYFVAVPDWHVCPSCRAFLQPDLHIKRSRRVSRSLQTDRILERTLPPKRTRPIRRRKMERLSHLTTRSGSPIRASLHGGHPGRELLDPNREFTP